MPAKRNEASVLGEKMLHALQGMKRDGSAYPPSLGELARFADADADPSLVLKAAAAKKPFGEHVVALQPKHFESPVVLKGDEASLLEHARTWTFLLELACSAAKPTIEPGKLRTKVPVGLRSAWDETLKLRLDSGQLPEGVELLHIGRKTVLHLKRYPLPRPAEEVLAEKMIEHLRSRRQETEPTTLAALQKETAPNAAAALVKKALATAVFKQGAVLGTKAQPTTPVALAEDARLLAGSDLLLLAALRLARSGAHQAVNIVDLKKKVAGAVQPLFASALTQRGEDASVPAGVGILMQKKAPVFFLLEDVVKGARLNGLNGGRDVEDRHSAGRDVDFERAFDAAFTDLDRAKGSHNFVSLLDLRPRVPVKRQTFDEGLRTLRRAGKFTLSASEGRHGLTAEELEAGVRGRAHLLYVSRKK